MKTFLTIFALTVISVGAQAKELPNLQCKQEALKRAQMMAEMDYYSNSGVLTKATGIVTSEKQTGDGACAYEVYEIAVSVKDTQGSQSGKIGASVSAGVATMKFHLDDMCSLEAYTLSHGPDQICDGTGARKF